MSASGRRVYDYKIAILPEIVQQFRHLGRSPQRLYRTGRRAADSSNTPILDPSGGHATMAPIRQQLAMPVDRANPTAGAITAD